jgi:hypothetical protein
MTIAGGKAQRIGLLSNSAQNWFPGIVRVHGVSAVRSKALPSDLTPSMDTDRAPRRATRLGCVLC